jgi:hypothetical protein
MVRATGQKSAMETMHPFGCFPLIRRHLELIGHVNTADDQHFIVVFNLAFCF